MAVLSVPVVRLKRAPLPPAVLPPAACAAGEGPSQATASAMTSTLQRKNDQLIDVFGVIEFGNVVDGFICFFGKVFEFVFGFEFRGNPFFAGSEKSRCQTIV